jgi:hypothetical protein
VGANHQHHRISQHTTPHNCKRLTGRHHHTEIPATACTPRHELGNSLVLAGLLFSQVCERLFIGVPFVEIDVIRLLAHNPNTPLYGRDPQRAYATGSQGSFQSFASSMKQEPIPTPSTRMSMAKKMGRRKRALSDAAPPAPHFYTEPAYRAQQFYPMGPTSPMPNTAYAAVPTPGSRAMPLSTPRYETAPGRPGRTPSQSSLQMAVYHHEQNTPAYVPRETFTPEMAPREPPRVLRRRRTVSSTQTHPPQIPIPGHVANMEPASYGSHGSYMMQAHSQGPKKQPQLPTIKFKRKGIPQGGVTLSEAITGVRMSRKDRYPVRMMHADPDMNVLIKITVRVPSFFLVSMSVGS